jgi:hypothetical protein
MNYKLKSWTGLFQPIYDGRKTHDLRDKTRPFKVGDILTLQEYDQFKGEYTGRECDVEITYITSNETPCAFSSAVLSDGFCILSISKVNNPRDNSDDIPF